MLINLTHLGWEYVSFIEQHGYSREIWDFGTRVRGGECWLGRRISFLN